MHILIAPNAFKNSLTAEEAASAIREGFMQSKLDCDCECFPIGDGGDGTAALIIKKCGGLVVNTTVHDPFGKEIITSFGLIDEGKTAVIEMADASGLRLLKRDELNPLLATSFGTGEQIKMALDKGVKKIIIGMGGSATVDGGCGMLKALGVRFLDANGLELSGLPANFINLASIDLAELDNRVLKTEVIVLCDVDNVLLGDNGAAAMFGPQKGASPQQVLELDAALLADVDHVLLSSEPYRFRERDIVAVQKLLPPDARCGVRLIDGEMTSWYGSRAIRGVGYLAQLRRSLG